MERRQKGKLSWAIVLLIIIFACAIAYGGAWIYTSVRNSSSFGSYKVMSLDSLEDLIVISDGFIYYDGSSISKVDEKGNTAWSYMIGSNAEISASDEGVAAWVGVKLTLLDTDKGTAEYSGNMDDDVLSAVVGSEYTAVEIGEEHNSTIVIMESGGRSVDSITLSDVTVIDYGFFYNDTLFWVMTLDSTGTTPSCTVDIYRPGKRLVGSITDLEQLIYHVEFQSNQICCTGDTYIRIYDYNGTEDEDRCIFVYGWTLVDADDSSDNPLMAYTLNGQYDSDDEIQDVRMIRGTTDQIVHMPYGCATLIAKGTQVYGFSTDGYVMIAKLGNQKVNAYEIPVIFDQVYGITSGNMAVLGSGTTVYLVSMD